MSKQCTVITYEDNIVFNYSISEENADEQIVREVTLVWEDALEKFLEQFGEEKPYQLHEFLNEYDKNRFIEQVEAATESIIDGVDEEIAQKAKFSHVYTSPTYED